MAEKLDKNFDYGRAGGGSKYPWEEWAGPEVVAAGTGFRVKRGADFTGTRENFRGMLYNYAIAHGLKAHVMSEGEEELCFHFVQDPDALAASA